MRDTFFSLDIGTLSFILLAVVFARSEYVKT